MPEFVEGRTRTFQAGAALVQHRRVKLSSGKLAYADADDTDVLGTMAREAFAVDEYVAVVLANAEGTQIMVASEAITVGTVVQAAADGKVAATGTVGVGIALSAAVAANDWIEVLPL